MSIEASLPSADLIASLDRSGRRLGFASTLRNHAFARVMGLHATDWAALDLLDWAGPIPIGRLAAELGVSPAAATALVDRLEGSGHVERRRASDRRVVMVHPVGDRGADHDELDRVLRARMIDHATGFTQDELDVVLRFMEGAADVLSEVAVGAAARGATTSGATGRAAAGRRDVSAASRRDS